MVVKWQNITSTVFFISVAAHKVYIQCIEAIHCISSRPLYYNWHNQFSLNTEND